VKHFVLAFIALTSSASVAAEWLRIGETESYDIFIDPDTISADGHLRKSWEIRNLKIQSRAGESDQFRMEYDCKGERSRILYWSVHTGRFALGKLTKLGLEASLWHPIRPYTIDWDLLRIVCSKQPKPPQDS
jgi:hypothetical protein